MTVGSSYLYYYKSTICIRLDCKMENYIELFLSDTNSEWSIYVDILAFEELKQQ